MRILFVVASLLCASLPVMAAAPPPPPLSDAAKARLAPLFDAYAALDKELAALPPAKTDAEKLLRLKRRDDLGRVVYRQIDFVSLPLAEGRPAVMAAELEIERQDVINQTELKKILPARGWFLTSEIGADAAVAAAQIVQHATNADMPFVRPDPTVPQWLFDYFSHVVGSLEPIAGERFLQGEKRGSGMGAGEEISGIRQAPSWAQDPKGYQAWRHYKETKDWEKVKKREQRQKQQYGGTEQ